MSILEKFAEWEALVRDELHSVEMSLNHPLSDEPEALIADLAEIEAYNGRCGSLLAEANSFLDHAKYVLRPSKESGTSFDRQIDLDNAVSPIRCVRDKLDAFCDSIKQRLILGESLLRYYSQFKERKPRIEESPF